MNKVEIFYGKKNLSTFMAVLKTICTPGSAIWPNSLESIGNRFDYSFSSQLMMPELGGMSCLVLIRLLSRRI